MAPRVEFPSDRIEVARAAGERRLSKAALPIEPPEVALAVERHRWAWRPHVVRTLLIAESHVYTSADDIALTIRRDRLPPVAQYAPAEYVRLIYCLGYGEDELLTRRPTRSNAGTPQFWNIFGRLAGTGRQPRKGVTPLGQRLDWKVGTLSALRERGVWLVDASLHGIYAPGGQRVGAEITRDLHRVCRGSSNNPRRPSFGRSAKGLGTRSPGSVSPCRVGSISRTRAVPSWTKSMAGRSCSAGLLKDNS